MAGVPEVVRGYFKYTLAAGVLTVAAVGVTKVRFPKQGTYGDFVTLDLTGKSYTFTDGTVVGHSFPVDMFMGISDLDWGSAMPWYDYLCNIDNTAANVVMGMSRNWKLSEMPAHAACDFFDGLASGGEAQGNMAVWVNHAAGTGGQPCVRIGSHTMIYDKAGHDTWEVQTLTAKHGFGKFQFGDNFTFPLGQNGCDVGKNYTDSGGSTALAFTTYVSEYQPNEDGSISYQVFDDNQTSAGDAQTLYFKAPYASANYGNGTYVYGGCKGYVGSNARQGFCRQRLNGDLNIACWDDVNGDWQGDDFSGATDMLYFGITYPVF